MGISIERATLASVFVESTLYGIFLTLYVIANVILYRGRKHSRINTPMVLIAFGMLCLSTLNTANDLTRLLTAFLEPNRSAADYLTIVNDPSYTVLTVANGLQTLLGDGFLLYRLYLVWERNYLVVSPLILSYIGSAVAGVGFLRVSSTVPDDAQIFESNLYRWALGFCLSTLITNTMCTCLIAGKIYWVHRRSASLGLGGSSSVSLVTPMVLIIESGAIYSVSLSFQIGLYTAGSYGLYVVYNSMPNIIAISFTLLIVHLGLGLSAFGNGGARERTAQFKSVVSMLDYPSAGRSGVPAAPLACQCGQGVGMRALDVHVSRDITTVDELNSYPSTIRDTISRKEEGGVYVPYETDENRTT